MSVEACRECGRLFPYLPRGVCGECLEAREKQFDTVRQWLRKNRAATARLVAEATEVPIERIHQWVSEGRLTLAKDAEHTATAEEQAHQDQLRERLKGDLLKAVSQHAATEAPSHGMHHRRH
ncbi:MAG: hypothetical protein U0Y82_07075 [Thermoleophilia bacterium]